MRTQDTYWIQNPFPKLPERSDPGADAAQQCVSLVQSCSILVHLALLGTFGFSGLRPARVLLQSEPSEHHVGEVDPCPAHVSSCFSCVQTTSEE